MSNTKTVNLKTDLVIIGGGGSGLTAAVSAAESGVKSIIILEKRAKLGGNAVYPGGMLAADSALQKKLGYSASRDEIFRLAMDFSHWKINGTLVRVLIDKSADTICWLQKKGINFVRLIPHYPNQMPNTYHSAEGPTTTGFQIVNMLIREFHKYKGISVLLQTPAKKLSKGRDGSISGVVAQSRDGKEIIINTRSVIICTGGFSGNVELLKQYNPAYNKALIPPIAIAHKGDGIRMASEAGAALDGMVTYEYEGHIAGSNPLTVVARRPLTVWVNRQGKRFIDENVPFMTDAANAVNRQPGSICYCLFDQDIKERILADTLGPFELHLMGILHNQKAARAFPQTIERHIQMCLAKNRVLVANSWAQIAQWIGAKQAVLENTINEYNRFCDHGHDCIFDKKRIFLAPLRKPPYYAMLYSLKMLTTHGGIKINECMQAVDEDNEPIPGLFAAGVETGATDWDTYNMGLSGHSFSFAINSGRIAGEGAAAYLSR